MLVPQGGNPLRAWLEVLRGNLGGAEDAWNLVHHGMGLHGRVHLRNEREDVRLHGESPEPKNARGCRRELVKGREQVLVLKS